MLRPRTPAGVARRSFATARSAPPRSTSHIGTRTALAVAGAAAAVGGYTLVQQQRALDLDAEPGKGKWETGGVGQAMRPEVFLCVQR